MKILHQFWPKTISSDFQKEDVDYKVFIVLMKKSHTIYHNICMLESLQE